MATTIPCGIGRGGAWPASPRQAAAGAAVQRLAIVTVVAGVMYNALLAILAAHGVAMNVTVVIACEILILLTALGASAMGGARRSDALPLGYIYFSATLTLVMSLAQTRLAIDGLRNVLIIAGFTLLGGRVNERTVRTVFTVCSAVMLLVLIWEISALESYAATFRPADYLAATRGYAVQEFYEDVGLSIGTIAYSSRFSFGIFTGPRTSSIMLEQVGINCFAITLMIYSSSLWSRLSIMEKILLASTIVLIILSNNARMASLILPVIIIGYFVFPRLPRYLNLAIPVVLLAAMLLVFQFHPVRIGDDLIGRLGVTYKFLSRLTPQDLLAGNPRLLTRAFDTGYGYTIAANTIFGAFAYWTYLTFVVPQDSAAKRRTAWSMNTYIYLWLMVGGTASFSMKTASLLWFLVGFIRVSPGDSDDVHRVLPKRL
ncbi:hypothetical protein [Novosphingobium sp. 9U]|uniref:hypothetical protein n=1 Tax=Novosphingobium sp. 9U TaxID=2653158 RepID=UPI0012F2DAFA|nr:hypothetical protein [Novosphingobium sp. 9U]VWX50978.1 conserved membrane hypothetical protein [Novosphingobium sp. 9U]